MPELADVEVYRRYLNATALHQRIKHVHVQSASILFETSAQGLGRVLKHKSFHKSDRHGKYLFIAVNKAKWLVMHFGMTGELKYFQRKQDAPDYSRLLISFDNGYHLAYITRRKLGRVAITESPQAWISKHKLGPDALKLTEQQFFKLAAQRRGGVKSWLMDQQSIAGIGNIYSDEILFQARIHPRSTVNDLDEAELAQLYKAVNSVFDSAIRAHADPGQMPAGFLLPRRVKDGRCPACDTPLETLRAAGRRAWYCPLCQAF